MDTTSLDESSVRVSADAHIGSAEVDRARGAIVRLAHVAPRPVVSARVRLTRHGDPAVARPVTARGALDVSGRLVVARADGATPAEAVDGLVTTLRRRLENLDSRDRHDEPPPWRTRPAQRAWESVPDHEREIVVHTSWSPEPCTVDEAAREMGMLGLDFHLFTEQGTGQDCVLYRAGEQGYRLALTTPPGPHDLAPFRLPVTVSQAPAPVLTAREAIARMEALGLGFLYYLDGDRGRGAVVHRRADGHYGLVEPAS